MTAERVERRLAAVLAADVAGYSRLMGTDEEGTLARLKAIRKSLVDPAIASHRGRIVKTTGDGVLVEFSSAVDATRCAVELQRGISGQNIEVPQDKRIEFRIGIHVGDIIFDDNDIFGDGVNIAARLEGIAEPGGVCISDDAQRQVRGKVDFAFDDIGIKSLKNIVEPMRAWRVQIDKTPPAIAAKNLAVETPQPLALPNKPSIAVLPFQNMSGDPEQDYFADGMVEDIITALARFKSLFVIARNSSFTYKGRAVDIKQVGRELGVRYILEGSVRKASNRLRVTGQLIDAVNGAHVWADRFDGSVADVFDLQDEIASKVAGVIAPALQAAEIERVVNRPTADLDAYDLYLRALPLVRAWAREPVLNALDLLSQAIQRDPNYGPALGAAAFCHSQKVWSGWVEDAEAARHAGTALARRALDCASDDADTVGHAAGALMNFGEDINVLKTLIDNTIARNPSSAFSWFWSGWMRTFSGEADIAIEHFEKSLRLDPRATRLAFHLTGIGICHLFRRRFDQAAVALETSLHELPTYTTTSRCLISCYAHLGRLAEARELVARHEVGPGEPWLNGGALFRDDEQRALLFDGLALAIGSSP